MKTFELTVEGKDYKIDIEKFDGKQAVVKVDGKPYEIDVKKAAEAVVAPRVAPPSPGVPQDRGPATPEPPLAPVASVPSAGQVLAPMPGLILEVMVSVGDSVAAGTPVVKMEAMKMENEIPAPAGGTVKELRVKVGDQVSTDDVLVVIDQG
ncbi:MAG: biotin/lipoyl-binding protein [Proteobacteria bacterium]|nr:biotin/lipoyl-binding protein [Pseudomonadota bacterium]